jgi:hypothetical protein
MVAVIWFPSAQRSFFSFRTILDGAPPALNTCSGVERSHKHVTVTSSRAKDQLQELFDRRGTAHIPLVFTHWPPLRPASRFRARVLRCPFINGGHRRVVDAAKWLDTLPHFRWSNRAVFHLSYLYSKLLAGNAHSQVRGCYFVWFELTFQIAAGSDLGRRRIKWWDRGGLNSQPSG